MAIEQRGDASQHIPETVFDASEADAIGHCSLGIRAAARRAGERIDARVPLWAALVASFVLAGCVTVEEPAQAAQPRDEGVYRTGSRLPSRDSTGASPVGAVSKDEWLNNRREGAGAPTGTKGQ
jgi:hypothetical protein